MPIDYYILEFLPYGFLAVALIGAGILVKALGGSKEEARQKLGESLREANRKLGKEKK